MIGTLIFIFEAIVHFNKSSLCSFITQMTNEIIAHIVKASIFEIFSHTKNDFITFVMIHKCSLEN